jgi:YD repeat-containing protein
VEQAWTTSPAGTGSRSGRREVDALGNTIEEKWGTFADAWEYDALGRVREETLAARPPTSFTYEEGLLTLVTYGIEQTKFGYWANGKPFERTDPDGRERRLAWDERGLLAKEEFGRGSNVDTRKYAYDEAGNLATMKHGLGAAEAEWVYASGPRGEVLRVTQPGGVGEFRYSYDARAALIGITAPAGSPSAAQFFQDDYLGRQVQRVRGGATWTTEWANGTGTTTEPFDGAHPGQRVIARVLDDRGRALVTTYSGVASDLTKITAEYDALDQPVRVVEARGSGDVTTGFVYGDARKLLTGITRSGATVAYTRTASGQVESMTSPAGTVSYGYDALDRLARIGSGLRATSLTWEPGGQRLLEAQDGVRLHECRRYDDRGRVTVVSNVELGENCLLTATPIARFEYAYDDRGNRLREDFTDATNPMQVTHYGYDKADRLTGVHYPSGTAKLYQLGGDGSRLAEKESTPFPGGLLGPEGWSVSGIVQTYGYDAQGGLTSVKDALGESVVTYAVDKSGRVRSETRGTDTKQFQWDADGRLVEAKVSKGVAGGGASLETMTYRYDWAGRRVEKASAAGTTRYVWGAGELVEEVLPGGVRLQYERAGELVVGLATRGADGMPVSERFVHDGLGSVAGRVRSDGTDVAYRYDAWGSFRGASAPASGEASLAYAGQHWDADLGLSYAQQRWYAPEVAPGEPPCTRVCEWESP